MLLCESPALALLPVPPLQRLPAGCLYLIPHLAVLGDYVVIHGLSLLVEAFHIQPSFLNVHFQSACLPSSFNQILTVILSAVGCVNWYASTHFGMSRSGMTG